MAFVPNPNTGTLWPNEYKKNDSHPDVKGDLHLDRALLKTLMEKHPEGLIKVAVAGWNKEITGKPVLSLSASEPYEKPKENDLPY